MPVLRARCELASGLAAKQLAGACLLGSQACSACHLERLAFYFAQGAALDVCSVGLC